MASQLILFLFFLSFSCFYLPIYAARSEHEIKLLYEGWLVEQHKNYNDLFEKEKRYEIFKDNLKYIDEHNAGNHSYTLGLTVFADLTNDEYRKTFLGYQKPIRQKMNFNNEDNRYNFSETLALPDSVDWRKAGAVTPVKNQGKCNNCWAFSAIASIEGLNKIVTGNLISLSEQEILDCYKRSCGRGRVKNALQFIIDNGGIASEEDYPYKGYYAGCQEDQLQNKAASIGGYRFLDIDEFMLQFFTAQQPISVVIESSGKDFQHYASGIFDGPCGTDLDHAVTVVGYGSEDGMDYWLIKNSWGENWGEHGYVRLRRNINGHFGKCGIALEALYPTKMKIGNPVKKKGEEQSIANWPHSDTEGKKASE